MATYDGVHPETTVDRWSCIRSVVVLRGRDEADPRPDRAEGPLYIGASSMTDRMMILDVFSLGTDDIPGPNSIPR